MPEQPEQPRSVTGAMPAAARLADGGCSSSAAAAVRAPTRHSPGGNGQAISVSPPASRRASRRRRRPPRRARPWRHRGRGRVRGDGASPTSPTRATASAWSARRRTGSRRPRRRGAQRGHGGGPGLEGSTAESWDRVLAVNLRAHFLVAKRALPVMEGGSIVFVGSLAGLKPAACAAPTTRRRPRCSASAATSRSRERAAACARTSWRRPHRHGDGARRLGRPPRARAGAASRCAGRAAHGRWPMRPPSCFRRGELHHRPDPGGGRRPRLPCERSAFMLGEDHRTRDRRPPPRRRRRRQPDPVRPLRPAYAKASNQDMLTATLDGLVARFGLQGERLGEVVAGAVLKHSRDFNLTRECVLGSRAVARDARLRRPAGVRHRPRGRDPRREQDRARARSSPASPAASTRPPTRRSRVNEDLRDVLLEAEPREVDRRTALEAARPQLRPGQLVPDDPAQRRAAHRPVDGRARRRSPPSEWGIAREEQDELAAALAPATSPPPTTAASSTTWSRRTSGLERDQNLRPDSTLEKLGQAQAGLRRARTAR